MAVHSDSTPLLLESGQARALSGTARVPGDKSISHRALMFGALAVGETVAEGLLEGEDVMNTAAAMRAFGAKLEKRDGRWHIQGVGVGGLAEPADILDMGNSGTSARLLMGLAATHDIFCVFTGDASLRRRPMQRVIAPLTGFGAQFIAREGGRLPLAVRGARTALPQTYRLPVASAQVKSAVLLAGLNAPGETQVLEPIPSRDHTENMLQAFGARLAIDADDNGVRRIRLQGQPELKPTQLVVPGDPSSAAFPLVAAAILPGSDLTIQNIGINPLRIGLIDCLIEMGADIAYENERTVGGERVADLRICHRPLKAIEVPAARAPSMIDEYPILAVACACAQGRSVMRGLEELRVKESDRLTAVVNLLRAAGAQAYAEGDDLIVEGNGGPPTGGGMVSANLDHRIAMSALVLGAATTRPMRVDDGRAIATSFPNFVEMMNDLGLAIRSLKPGH